MITKVSDSVWKLSMDSNLFLIEPEKIIIDCGPRAHGNLIDMFLSKVIDPKEVKQVFFTHLHYDHIGNFDKFPNATFHASAEEIALWKRNPQNTILDKFMADHFKPNLSPFPKLDWLEVIPTPGHTAGSVCFWMDKEKILFTGDTIFNNGQGRIDFPTSRPKLMQESIMKLLNYNFRVLCPGHDY